MPEHYPSSPKSHDNQLLRETFVPTLTNNSPTDMAKAAPGGLDTATELAGRILLAALFMLSGVGKITAYEAAWRVENPRQDDFPIRGRSYFECSGVSH